MSGLEAYSYQFVKHLLFKNWNENDRTHRFLCHLSMLPQLNNNFPTSTPLARHLFFFIFTPSSFNSFGSFIIYYNTVIPSKLIDFDSFT